MDADDARKRLAKWRADRENAAKEADALASELGPLIVQAKEAGLRITQIAEIGGISRSTIYTYLKGTEKTGNPTIPNSNE